MAAPISGDRLADLNAIAHRLGLAGQQLRQALPARLQWLWAHVRYRGAENNRLAVEHGAINRQRRDGIPNAGEGVAVIRRGTAPQAHPLAILAGDHPVSVELDLVQPAGARRRPIGQRRLAGAR